MTLPPLPLALPQEVSLHLMPSGARFVSKKKKLRMLRYYNILNANDNSKLAYLNIY